MIIFWLILAFLLLVLFLIAPSPKCSRARQYREKAFAHRGLHGSNYGAAENCLKAFSLACKQGYGLELDVRFTKDRRLVVFHDAGGASRSGDHMRKGSAKKPWFSALFLPVQLADKRHLQAGFYCV